MKKVEMVKRLYNDSLEMIDARYKKNIIIIFFAIAFIAVSFKWSTVLLILTLIVWLSNVRFCIKYTKERIVLLLFHITYFIFLLGRPLISLLRPNENWIQIQIKGYKATEASVFLTIFCMLVSLISIRFGTEYVYTRKEKKEFPKVKEIEEKISGEWIILIRVLALVLFFISSIFELTLGIEKLLFVLNNSYVELYSTFLSRMPYIVYVLSTFLSYSLAAYLATLPSKKMTYIVLGVYVFTALPVTFCGGRTKIVQYLLLTLVYCVFRDYISSEEKWFGKTAKILLAFAGTGGILALGMLNYVREGEYSWINPFALFIDFFYKQGVSFSWLCGGFAHISNLQNMGVINYTFGGLIDYFLHGVIARYIFDADSLPNTNSMLQIIDGNSMDHHLSYVLLGKDVYLDGHGTGSSYLLETYTDYSMLGIILFSLLLGYTVIWIVKKSKSRWFARLALFCSMGNLMTLPRSNAISPIEFLWKNSFWCMLLYLALGILGRYIVLRIKQKKAEKGSPQDCSQSKT